MSLSSDFDKLAPIYRLMEKLLAGNLMHRARTAHLDPLCEPKTVLMLGEGPGRLLINLIQRFPAAHYLVLDQSQAMLDRAHQSLIDQGINPSRLEWLQRDVIKEGIPDGKFDLVTTPFFLDCFTKEQLETLIPAITLRCSPTCEWLLCDFQIPPFGVIRRWRAMAIHKLMYAFFSFVTGIQASHWEDPDPVLRRAGFKLIHRSELNLGLIRSDHWKRVERPSDVQ